MRELTTNDIEYFNDLTEVLEAFNVDEFVINTPTGVKKISLANIKKALVPYIGATSGIDLGDKSITAENGLFGNVKNTLDVIDPDYILDARQGKVLKDLIDALKGLGWTTETLMDMVKKVDVNNTLTVETGGKVLDARQGKTLKDLIDAIDLLLIEMQGAGWTDESIKDNADAIGVLENDMSAVKGPGWDGETLKEISDDLKNHKLSYTPHKFKNYETGKEYYYGFQISDEGNPQVIYKEIENV